MESSTGHLAPCNHVVVAVVGSNQIKPARSSCSVHGLKGNRVV